MKDFTLTVIVPFYNEELFLEQSVNNLINENFCDQIILVNDASTDTSVNIAQELINNYNNMSLINIESNLGKGNALKEAIKNIKTTHVAIHDADLEYYPSDLKKMAEVSKLNPENIILGSRFIGNKERKNIYFRTYSANKIMSLFFSFIFLKKVSDIATCYKLFPTEASKELNLKEKGFGVEVELTAKLLKKQLNIIECPINYSARSYEEGKKIKFKDGINYIFKTVYYRFFE